MKTTKAQKSRVDRSSVSAVRKTSRPQSPLITSPAQAKRESAGLRRGRENLESETTAALTDIRTSLP